MLNFEIDIDESLLEEKINISFRKFFNIQNFSIQLKEDVDDLNWFFNEEFSPRIDENFSVQLKNGHIDLNELFRKDFYVPKKLSFDVELKPSFFSVDESFSKFFDVETFDFLLDESKNINDSLFEEYFHILENDRIQNNLNFLVELDSSNIKNINRMFNDSFHHELIQDFSVQLKNGHIDLNELFRKDFYTPKKTSFDVGLRYNSFHLNQIHLNESSHLNQSFSKFFDVETFDFLLDESKNINDSLFEEYFKIREIIEQPNIEVAVEQVVKKYFETNLDQTKNVTDLIFEEYFELKQKYDYDNIQKLRESLDNGEILSKEDKEEFLQIESLSCVENEKTENFNEEFEKFFEVTRSSLDLSTLQNLKPQKVDIVEPEPVLEKLIVEVEEPFPFRVRLNEKNFIYDCEFRKHFKIHNFKTCVDRSKNIDDLVFEEHFEIKKQPEYDYNIIENLKKDLNSRKIVTREERESVVLNEPEVSVLEDAKESIELNVEETTSIIKDNRFYKIVEADIPKHIEPEIDTSYKDEVEKQLFDMESKYENLLQKTKQNYESQLNKMANDLSDFRNHINHQVTRMSFISSATGGGAVNILDMDDVNKSNLSDGYTLSYNSLSKKFDFINIADVGSSQTFDLMKSEIYTLTETDISNGYIELSFNFDPLYNDISELVVNGLINYHGINYSFISENRVDITSLELVETDVIKITYIRK